MKNLNKQIALQDKIIYIIKQIYTEIELNIGICFLHVDKLFKYRFINLFTKQLVNADPILKIKPLFKLKFLIAKFVCLFDFLILFVFKFQTILITMSNILSYNIIDRVICWDPSGF